MFWHIHWELLSMGEGQVRAGWGDSSVPLPAASCSGTQELSLPHSLPTFPTQLRGSAFPPPAFPSRAAAFSSRKRLNIAAFPGSGCGREAAAPSVPSPRSRSLLFIHSFIDPSSHSFIHASAPCAIQPWLPVPQVDLLGFSPLSMLPSRDSRREFCAGPAVC